MAWELLFKPFCININEVNVLVSIMLTLRIYAMTENISEKNEEKILFLS